MDAYPENQADRYERVETAGLLTQTDSREIPRVPFKSNLLVVHVKIAHLFKEIKKPDNLETESNS